ncbi:hypothetical protein BDV06DRAFT_216843 [Aspergillus oleicola]
MSSRRVIHPLKSDQHPHTLILLHGRGSNSERFGQEFISSTGLDSRLPTTKLIFPTVSKRRSTILKRTTTKQWLDNYSLGDLNIRAELQLDELRETGAFLRNIVDEEGNGDQEGYSRVLIGGLSQGCAASAFRLLAGGFDKALGGVIGMIGWLPLENEISGILGLDENLDEDDDKNDDDLFGSDGDAKVDGVPVPAHIQAVNHIRDVLDLSSPDSNYETYPNHLQTPVFLACGAADLKISVRFNMGVTWKAYEEFGHLYKVSGEIDDVLVILREKTSVPVVDGDVDG